MSVLLKSPDGSSWWVYLINEVPSLGSTKNPAPGLIIDTVYEDPVWFSVPNRTHTLRWRISNAGVLTTHVNEQPMEAARYEYVEFISPAGVKYVYGLTEIAGVPAAYLREFESGGPVSRRLFTTVMHKGRMVWVADNRMPPPRRGM